MEPECKNITRLVLPAVRASIAEIMNKEYRYNQEQIAHSLGVVQVSVSKYLNRRYSSDIKRLKSYILKNQKIREIAEHAARSNDPHTISLGVNRLCALIAKEA